MATPLLLDRGLLRALEQLTAVCHAQLSGIIGYSHRSRFHGQGLEFSDFRRYSYGDDLRFIDWNAYLRLGKLLLKLYQTEQHIPLRVLLDSSGSMDSGEGEESKFLYAARLAATFMYLALLRLDTAVLVPFTSKIGRPLVASGGRDRFWPVLEFLGELNCAGQTDMGRMASEFLGNFRSPGMLILISDFFDEDGSTRAVEMIRSAGHDFVLLQVHSAEEERPELAGELILEETETGAERRIECSPESAALYARAFSEFSARIQRLALRNGGRYARAVTAVPYQQFVLKSLRTGQVLE